LQVGLITYSITPRTLTIQDTGKGKKSVVEDLPAVLRRIEHWHQGSVAHLKLTILDAEGKRVFQARPGHFAWADTNPWSISLPS
jgi:hypothetical protein